MQEKPPFSSSLDFFSNVYKGDTPSHTHPCVVGLLSGTPLQVVGLYLQSRIGEAELCDNPNFMNSALGVMSW